MQQSWVYIMSNKNNTTLYTGVTSHLIKRVGQHKSKTFSGFSAKYNCGKLVYFQEFMDINQAILLEKKIKAGNRAQKVRLINQLNPDWKDLAEGWILE